MLLQPHYSMLPDLAGAVAICKGCAQLMLQPHIVAGGVSFFAVHLLAPAALLLQLTLERCKFRPQTRCCCLPLPLSLSLPLPLSLSPSFSLSLSQAFIWLLLIALSKLPAE